MRETATFPWKSAPSRTTDEGERGFDRGSWLVLMLALLLLTMGTVQLVHRLTLPTLGWEINDVGDAGRPVLEQNLLGLPSPLRPGDVWVTLEGQPVIQMLLAAPDFGQPYRAGQLLTIGVERAGQRLEFEVPLGHWSVAAVLRTLYLGLWTHYPVLLGFLIAAFAFWQRPRLDAARLLLMFYVVQLLIYLSGSVEAEAGYAVADLVSPLSYMLTLFFGGLSYLLLLAPLLLHLCLTFPEPKPLLRRSPWLLTVAYLLPWLALAGFTASGTLYAFGRTQLYLLTGGYSLISSAVFVHTFMTVKDPLRRAQVRWVTFGFVALGASGIAWVLALLGVGRGTLIGAVNSFPSALVLTLCLALALLRYRLFDIDLILNRTLVYTALTACVVLLYIVTVGAVGALLGTRGNLTLSLLGTGLVAVLFQPLRVSLQRAVNRLLYGQRDEPYALLTRLSQQIRAVQVPEQMLPTLAQTVAETLKLPYAGLFLYTRAETGEKVEGVGEHGVAGAEPVVFFLEHQGERFGELRLEVSGALDPKVVALLHTIAQQASVAVYAVRQTRDLRRSRERLIAAREAERLRLRRDLHDGLGPTLAGLNLQLGALEHLADQPEAVRGALAEVQQEVRRAAAEVRRIVYDLRPPSLDQLGLEGALAQLVTDVRAEQAGLNVTLTLPGELDLAPPTLTPATEVALYRIVQEALTNTLRHARAQHLSVAVSMDSALRLTIRDDGCGLPEHYRAGVGLQSMRERAGELGGQFTLASQNSGAQRGTTISVELPLGLG